MGQLLHDTQEVKSIVAHSIAVLKGIKPDNLLSIERNQKLVDTIRDNARRIEDIVEDDLRKEKELFESNAEELRQIFLHNHPLAVNYNEVRMADVAIVQRCRELMYLCGNPKNYKEVVATSKKRIGELLGEICDLDQTVQSDLVAAKKIILHELNIAVNHVSVLKKFQDEYNRTVAAIRNLIEGAKQYAAHASPRLEEAKRKNEKGIQPTPAELQQYLQDAKDATKIAAKLSPLVTHLAELEKRIDEVFKKADPWQKEKSNRDAMLAYGLKGVPHEAPVYSQCAVYLKQNAGTHLPRLIKLWQQGTDNGGTRDRDTLIALYITYTQMLSALITIGNMKPELEAKRHLAYVKARERWLHALEREVEHKL